MPKNNSIIIKIFNILLSIELNSSFWIKIAKIPNITAKTINKSGKNGPVIKSRGTENTIKLK